MSTNDGGPAGLIDTLGEADEPTLRAAKIPFPKAEDEMLAIMRAVLDRGHDYGTCVYAMSIAATAAFNYAASKLGCTGFQASLADLDFVRRARLIDGPLAIFKAADLCYPQYDLRTKFNEWVEKSQDWVSERCAELLRDMDATGGGAHPGVVAHWEKHAMLRAREERGGGCRLARPNQDPPQRVPARRDVDGSQAASPDAPDDEPRGDDMSKYEKVLGIIEGARLDAVRSASLARSKKKKKWARVHQEVVDALMDVEDKIDALPEDPPPGDVEGMDEQDLLEREFEEWYANPDRDTSPLGIWEFAWNVRRRLTLAQMERVGGECYDAGFKAGQARERGDAYLGREFAVHQAMQGGSSGPDSGSGSDAPGVRTGSPPRATDGPPSLVNMDDPPLEPFGALPPEIAEPPSPSVERAREAWIYAERVRRDFDRDGRPSKSGNPIGGEAAYGALCKVARDRYEELLAAEADAREGGDA